MYNLLVIIISLILPIFILKNEIKVEKDIKTFIKNNKFNLVLYFSFVIGFIVRLINIHKFPNALNIDEASSGYEAFSILNYGIDRNGNFMPVFLEAWGSGQNALYSYILIPFIKIFGLTEFSIRLPMALIGCLSQYIMYLILKNALNKEKLSIAMIFFAIVPWHIMKSRWGLESNIFPDIVLYSVYFLTRYIKTEKVKNIYISSVILGLASYSYGTSYFFLPIFVFIILAYLLKKGKIKIIHAIEMLFIIFLISLPIIIFIIINTFHLDPIKIFFTIPILQENRYEKISNLFGDNFLKTGLENFKQSILILIKQYDTLEWNAYEIYGLTYIVSLPFTLVGIYKSYKSKEEINWIINIWFIVAILLLFVIEPNINRINIIMIPIIYYTMLGISNIFWKLNITKVFIPIIYISLFICFEITYFTTNWNDYYTFNSKLKDIIEYIDKEPNKKVYFEYCFKEPYIYVCFYTKYNTNDFVNTVEYRNNYKNFDSVKSFGRYYFYIPDEKEDDSIYVINRQDANKYKFNDKWQKYYISDFVILKKE